MLELIPAYLIIIAGLSTIIIISVEMAIVWGAFFPNIFPAYKKKCGYAFAIVMLSIS